MYDSDGIYQPTAAEARGEYFREAGFDRGDADMDFDAEREAYNEAEARESFPAEAIALMSADERAAWEGP